MKQSFREHLGVIKAQASGLLGSPKGYFVRYDHVKAIDRLDLPYPAVEALFASRDYEEFLSEMGKHVLEYQRFGLLRTDPTWKSGMFGPLDGIAAFAAVRLFSPKHIVEIGSGDSTRFLVKAGAPGITCIDPEPRRSVEELPVTLLKRALSIQDVELCSSLDVNDILFIDSSHLLLPNLDVDIQFNRIFPELKAGVIVHVHDIFLPDDYPEDWQRRYYNEQNALIGWILGGAFEVVYPGYYLATRHPERVRTALQGFSLAGMQAGSLWLRKR